MFPVPTSFFLTSGVGVHRERLTAFELALRDADIEQQNLVSVSSILPLDVNRSKGKAASVRCDPARLRFASWRGPKLTNLVVASTRA